jgi:hypothetical protein
MSGHSSQMPSWVRPPPSLPPKLRFKVTQQLNKELDEYQAQAAAAAKKTDGYNNYNMNLGRGKIYRQKRVNKSRRVSNRRRRNKSIRRRKN